MKKVLIVILVFALAGTVVFAQDAAGVIVSGWGRGVFEPLKIVKPEVGDLEAGSSVTSFLPNAAVGVKFDGKADRIGFNLHIRAGTDYAIVTTGNAYLWVKPLDFLTIGAGQFTDGAAEDGLRGKVGDIGGGFTHVVAPYVGGEDDIFLRFKSGNGGIILLKPVDGLIIGGVFNAGISSNLLDKNTFKKLQIGAGYQIGSIGLLRAQYIGGLHVIKGEPGFKVTADVGGKSYTVAASPDVESDIVTGTIQAAFALTAIDGLTLDIGAKIPLAYEVETTVAGGATTTTEYKDAIGVSAGVKFGAGDFSVTGRVDTKFAGSSTAKTGATEVKTTDGLGLKVVVEPAFNLGSFTVGADVGVNFTGEGEKAGVTTDSKLAAGVGAWALFPYSNGFFQAGLAAQLPLDKADLVFSVPLVLQYSF